MAENAPREEAPPSQGGGAASARPDGQDPAPPAAPPLSTVRLLETLTESQSSYIADAGASDLFGRLLADLLDLTASSYGFIAEVRRTPDGTPYLKTHALTNIAWDDATRRLYDTHAAQGLEFRNLETLFGRVLTTGKPLLTNSPGTDPRRGGLPPGHPTMHSFLGIPVHRAGALVGMIAMSNRPGGYDEAVIEYLRPFTATVGAAIASYRLAEARRRTEVALRDSEVRHRSILETVVDAILTVDERGTIESCNRAAEQLFGWSREELAGRNVSVLMPEPFAGEHDDYLRRYLESGASRAIGRVREVTGLRRNGTTFPASLSLGEARLPSGRRFVGVLRDVTAQKTQETALRSVTTRLSTLIESMHAGVLLETEDRRIALVNDRFCAAFGIPAAPADLFGADCAEAARLSAPLFRDPVRFLARVEATLAARTPIRGEIVEMADGRVFERDFVPLFAGDAYAGHFWQYRDVTDRVRATEALQASEARKTGILESAQDAILSIDHRGRVLDFNAAAERIFGWSRGEAMGRDLGEMILPVRMREGHRRGMEHFLRTGEGPVLGRRLELPALRRDGTEFPVEVSIAAIRSDVGPVFTAHVRDITERKAQEQELRDARDAAVAASRFKTDFLASMSHEIRTPMTAIVGYSDMLLRADLPASEQGEIVRHLQRNADHLLALLNDILDLSKIEAGQMQTHPEQVPFVALLAGVDSLLRPRALQRGLTFDVRFATPVPGTVRTDPLRLRQILLNLAGNAIKFTDRGGVTVRVSFERPGGTGEGALVIAVEDTGIGMTDDQLPLLFSPFCQAHEPGARRPGGTGLGLAISQRLAHALGGSIAVTSEKGVGSVFTLRLPVAAADCGALVARPDLTTSHDARARGAGPRLDGLRILVVDDNPDNQRIERYLLEDAGAVVETAEDGRRGADAALAAAAAGRGYDAILMDMQMPVLDGYAATAEIRRAGLDTPVVAVTAHALAEDARRCLDAGCDAYLSKPLAPAALLETIARFATSAGERVMRATVPAAARTTARPTPLSATPLSAASVPQVPHSAASPAPARSPAISDPLLEDPRFRELVDDYVRQLPEQAESIRAAVAAGDRDRLRVLAHRLRGTGASFGLPRVTELAGLCEDALRATDADDTVAARAEALARLLDGGGR